MSLRLRRSIFDSLSTGSFRSAPQQPVVGSFPNRPNATEKSSAAASLKTPPVLSVQDILKALITPLIAIAYLAFCYVVHNRPVRLGHLVDVTEENLCTCCPSPH